MRRTYEDATDDNLSCVSVSCSDLSKRDLILVDPRNFPILKALHSELHDVSVVDAIASIFRQIR